MAQVRPYLLITLCAVVATAAVLLTVSGYGAYGATILLTHAENGLSNCF